MENLKREIERINKILNKKSTSAWMVGQCKARLEAIWTDPDYPEDVRHMAAEASK